MTHIERTPKYNPIPWVYPEKGPQFQGDPKTKQPYTPEQLRGMKERPAAGDPVTFKAHVVNASDATAPAVAAEWAIDGTIVRRLQCRPLGPWETAVYELAWTWADGPHTVRFVVDPDDKLHEACEKNNSLTDRTDALALQMRVTQQLYDAFRITANKLGSRSFEDWVHRHILIMNNTFAACAYERTCPEGIRERVRVDDFVIMTKDEMHTRQPQTLGCDGGWNFYDDNFPAWFDGHISMDFTTGVDWGLIHELTHQLGIIDLYTIVVSAHWNHVRDAQGQPIWIGYSGSQPCIMSGSGIRTLPDGSTPPPLTLKVDSDGHVTAGQGLNFAAYSEHTAGGLSALIGKRRGHFGLYLFDIPARNFVRILDNAGKPVVGAKVTVYQQTPGPGPQSISEAPALSGQTDAGGVLPLGSRPFGDINTIGLNGILFCVVQARGHTEYRFLDISQFNIAQWQGQGQFTATFRTGIPPDGAPAPVRHLRYAIWDGSPNGLICLTWDAPLGGEVDHYQVYRVFAPQYHSISFQPRYEVVATVPVDETHAVVQPPPGYAGVTDVPCFMVTAVDAAGRESGYANDRELTRFAYPGGGARINRVQQEGKTILVQLGPQAVFHLRESALVEKGTRLKFHFHTTSQIPAGIRLSVAGLGDLQIPLVGPPAPNIPVLADIGELNNGGKEVSLELRPRLDAVAAQRQVSPAQARTSWNNDWLVTAFQFGHLTPAGTDPVKPARYRFEDFQLVREDNTHTR
ncbi:MAG: hypothetical protein HY000_31115 [Planctomycetes bacterium]|nr:hypothetical protein [Planctomycetota bacterium]